MRLIRIITLAVFLVSCSDPVADSPVNQNLVTAPTPLPNIYIDERGNGIKQDGWIPPDIKFGSNARTSKGTAKSENGESVSTEMVHRSVIDTVIEIPSAHPVVNERDSPSKIVRSISIAIPGNQPHCYILNLIRVNPPVVGPLVMKYCDSNGDGIFETSAKMDDPVPQWALSK